MANETMSYTFRDAEARDLAMLARWLATPEVSEWWINPAEQLESIRGDLADPRMVTWIVAIDGRPFGYVQHYEVHTWPQPHLDHLPVGTRGIDLFIGEKDCLASGHGARFLRIVANRLLAEGAPLIIIDPDARNARARRAFERAGFGLSAIVATADGNVALMIFDGRNEPA